MAGKQAWQGGLKILLDGGSEADDLE